MEKVGTAQTLPHIRIKDRVAYIAAGNSIKLVLFGSKQVAQGLFKSFSGAKHGFDAIEPEKPVESVPKALDAEQRKFFEDLRKRDKEREKEKERKAAADQDSQPKSHRTEADNAGASFPTPYGFGPPTAPWIRRPQQAPRDRGSRPVALMLRTISIRSWNNRTLPEI